MTNEEKILEMLTQMQGDIASLKETQDQQGQLLEKQGQLLEKHGQMIERLDERSQRTAVLLETEVDRKLNLLYEGHGIIMENLDQLAPRSRVERLEDDVALLKDAIKLMRQEISELKKAQ